jgi:hypothetical protein
MSFFNKKLRLITGPLIALALLVPIIYYLDRKFGFIEGIEWSHDQILENGLLDITLLIPVPTNLPLLEPLLKTTPSSSQSSPDAAVGITFEEDSKLGPFVSISPMAPFLSRLPNGTVRLEWYNESDSTAYFNVYRKERLSRLIKIGSVKAKFNGENLSFIDQSAHKDIAYIYTLTQVDAFGNESEYSDPSEISTSGK